MPEETLPQANRMTMEFENGSAIGTWQRWGDGQYCSVITAGGVVGCGIYDLATAAEFGQTVAIARGTPDNPLVKPQDLLEAKIVGMTPKAAALGILVGCTGREAIELMLRSPIAVRSNS